MEKVSFVDRHIGPRREEIAQILSSIQVASMEELIQETVPSTIRFSRQLNLPNALTESEALLRLSSLVEKNHQARSYIGMGYYDCITPPVIQRNILENPGWYTQYTPYQAEISQGRLEALLNFQTMIVELTGLPIANASLLDEGTAAAEAMSMCYALQGRPEGRPFLVSSKCHPQTIEVIRTRANPLGIPVEVSDPAGWRLETLRPFAVLLQYPGTDGSIEDPKKLLELAQASDVRTIVAADLLSLCLLSPPSELGADVVVGTTQRFGVPMGFGGPHAAYMSTRDEYKRLIPGRIVGVSEDAEGRPAIRLALQTREQHIRRDKATSNICTAQVLLAVMASMYAVYHGPEGLRKIAEGVNHLARRLALALTQMGYSLGSLAFFDTLHVKLGSVSGQTLRKVAASANINLRWLSDREVTVSMDEAVTETELAELVKVFAEAAGKSCPEFAALAPPSIPESLIRKNPGLQHSVFSQYHSETDMLRYIRRLESRDLSLAHSMIPLGSCTMKLNATAEMFPVSWPGIAKLHPFAPADQTMGYQQMIQELSRWLSEITGFPGVSLQPNAGSQGEYAGLLAIRQFHQSRGERQRNICLIPKSAHGTNPASAVMAGMQVVVVECDERGNVDLADLKAKALEHSKSLSALMVTYPSTHGVFEESIREICSVVHEQGGQVYMDGANMNAQVGLCRPGDFGPDVCHLNLHKTFCIPHGGGGPGMGPICVAKHLIPFLPGHPVVSEGSAAGAVSAAPYGSASILPISWMYIAMMGPGGLKRATEVAILNANYMARRLEPYYPVLYKGASGRVAHECILDLRPIKASAGVEVEDVAKRLMDYGFHAPTVSFPVAGTIMIEPTESESLVELDRFCDAMIAIREEIAEIEQGKADRTNNLLKHAPHTARVVVAEKWDRPYSRERAAFPTRWTREWKFWPAVSRINAVQGDRNLICACPPVESYRA